jgi:pimeloyl-ACP methyl ester carboxylesterase
MMHAVTFDRCLGWLHDAPGGRGVIICSAHGFEEMCSRVSMRLLAERLAESGLPTLRFDYHGTVDSPGCDDDPDRVATWLGNIRNAITWMRQTTGVEEVALVGLRLGATMAAVVAAEEVGIERLALLGPAPSGRVYTREMQLSGRVMVPIGAESLEREVSSDAVTMAGFKLADQTTSDLREVNVLKLKVAPAPHVLILQSEGRPGEEALANHLEHLGADVTKRSFRDYQRMMSDPTDSRPCLESIDVIVRWLREELPNLPHRGQTQIVPVTIRDECWTEEPLQFGERDRMVGILCCPDRPAPGEPCVAIGNTGRDYRIGWARSTVLLARHLANHGIASLRFDLPGIGDSLAAEPAKLAKLYKKKTAIQFSVAIDELERRGLDHIYLYGRCSGAYNAFQAAQRDSRVRNLILCNIQRYVWHTGDAIEFAYVDNIHLLRRPLGKVVFGAANPSAGLLDRVRTNFVRAFMACFRTAREIIIWGAQKSVALYNDGPGLISWVRQFTGRGGRLLFVYSSNDLGLPHFEKLFGKEGTHIRDVPGVSIEFVEGADHNFTEPHMQRRFESIVTRFILGQCVASCRPKAPRKSLSA